MMRKGLKWNYEFGGVEMKYGKLIYDFDSDRLDLSLDDGSTLGGFS